MKEGRGALHTNITQGHFVVAIQQRGNSTSTIKRRASVNAFQIGESRKEGPTGATGDTEKRGVF
jgi:hypothetical protein